MNNNNTRSINMAQRTVRLAYAILALAAVGFSSAALAAEDRVTRTHQIAVQGQPELMISNSVGKLEVRTHDAPGIQLEVTIEAGRRGMLRRKVDISDVDIAVKQDEHRIRLQLQEDNVSANWVVYVPSFEQVTLKVGVGQLHTEWLDSALNIDVGVGDVRVDVDIDSLGSFSANVGVGSIKADGVHDYVSTRKVVTESSRGRGRGEYNLDIEVGVGDIRVNAESPR